MIQVLAFHIILLLRMSAANSSLSTEDVEVLLQDGWKAYSRTANALSGEDVAPSFGWWFQKVYVNSREDYYGQR